MPNDGVLQNEMRVRPLSRCRSATRSASSSSSRSAFSHTTRPAPVGRRTWPDRSRSGWPYCSSKHLDPARHGRLGDAQHVSGPRQAPRADHFDQRLQVNRLHRSLPVLSSQNVMKIMRITQFTWRSATADHVTAGSSADSDGISGRNADFGRVQAHTRSRRGAPRYSSSYARQVAGGFMRTTRGRLRTLIGTAAALTALALATPALRPGRGSEVRVETRNES